MIKRMELTIWAVLFLWIKTYLLYKFSFHLKIENSMQEFILFINPLSSLLFLFGFAFIFRGKGYVRATIFIHVILTLVLLGNVVFAKFFNDFITVPLLFQTSNMSELGGSIKALIGKEFILYFVDCVVLIYIAKKKTFSIESIRTKKVIIPFYLVTSVLFIANLALAEIQRPELLSRAFDRQILVKNIGIFNYHAYDTFLQTKTQVNKVFADSTELTKVENYLNTKDQSKSELFGKYKGKNVIVVSMESLQSFVINKKVNGQEITPFLNKFLKESYYFENHYHQTGQGKTSDAEFLVENSLYPLGRGAVFFTNATNKYMGMPSLLKKDGYYSAVFHANNKSFWNRDIMYESLGYDRFFHLDDYTVTKENSIGWGLKDKDFFTQTIEKLKELPQPFYVKAITLTNHHPFDLEKEDEVVKPYTSGDETVDKYFATANYMDRALEQFVNDLKKSGLYDSSIIVFYGDHYGIASGHNKAMAQFLGKEVTAYDQVQLQRTPLIIHVPNQKKGQTISEVVGQINIRPTLLDLLGKQEEKAIQFGTSVFSKSYKPLVVFRNGTVITDNYIVDDGVLYNRYTGAVIEDKKTMEQLIEQGQVELDYSDQIIYGDLLRYQSIK
ncbi:MAG: LTA synthase family protein [Bacillaceae bacterium]